MLTRIQYYIQPIGVKFKFQKLTKRKKTLLKEGADPNFVNKDGVLKLRMPLEKKFRGEDTFIEVYYTDLKTIDANEGAQIVCNEQLEQDRIELRAQEGAQIEIGMKVRDAQMRAVTGGIIRASGLATNQVITINTGGVFEGRDLKTDFSSIKVSTGGKQNSLQPQRWIFRFEPGGMYTFTGTRKRSTRIPCSAVVFTSWIRPRLPGNSTPLASLISGWLYLLEAIFERCNG